MILAALFIFAYQGAEVSISGWVLSFLVQYRNGDLNRVGCVTAGFWGGITLGKRVHRSSLLDFRLIDKGRFILSHSGHHLLERKFVFALAAGVSIPSNSILLPSRNPRILMGHA